MTSVFPPLSSSGGWASDALRFQASRNNPPVMSTPKETRNTCLAAAARARHTHVLSPLFLVRAAQQVPQCAVTYAVRRPGHKKVILKQTQSCWQKFLALEQQLQ